MIGNYSKITVKDYELSRVQDAVSSALNGLGDVPFINGVVVENVPLLSASDNQIFHGLGRTFRYWLILRNNENSVIYEAPTQTFPDKILTLKCTANCTVSVWVG
jgi:hypothetical protein